MLHNQVQESSLERKLKQVFIPEGICEQNQKRGIDTLILQGIPIHDAIEQIIGNYNEETNSKSKKIELIYRKSFIGPRQTCTAKSEWFS